MVCYKKFGLTWFGCVLWHINSCGLFTDRSCLSTLAKELSAAASVIQSSSKELSTLVADRVLKKCKQTAAAAVAK